MKTILLTGSSGFIGSNLYELLSPIYNIICIDKKENINILDYDKLEQIFIDNTIDIIIHLAAIPGVRYSINHSQEVLNNNIIGFENICKLGIQYNVKHIVYASSSSVYGENNVPKSPYAISKCTNELQAAMYSSIYPNIKFTGLRFFTVYGKNIRTDLGLYKFIDGIKNNKPIYIYGDGTQSRDFTYVKDICNAIKCIIESSKSWNHEVFDIGYGQSVTINKLIDILKELLNTEFNQVIYQEENKYDVKHTLSDNHKLYDWFNFRPSYDIYHGLYELLLII